MVDLLSNRKPVHPFLAVHYFAQKTPEAPFLVSGEEVINYAVGSDRIKIMAAALAEQGVTKGDVVATKLSAELEIYAFHALYLLGAISCYVAKASTIPPEWEFTHVLTDEDPQVQHSEVLLRLDQLQPSTVEISNLNNWPDVAEGPNSHVKLVLTSGTTGLAKAAVFTAANFATYENGQSTMHMGYQKAGEAVIGLSLMGLGSVVSLRLFFSNITRGLPHYLVAAEFESLTKCLPAGAEFGAVGSPVQLQALANSVAGTEALETNKLKYLMVAGALPDRASLENFRRLFPAAEILSLYGSTEVGRVALGPVSEDPTSGYVGNLFADLTCQIVDDTGTELPDGQEGIIRVKRDHMVNEYRYDVFETARAFMRGWFYPGDLGYKTQQGELFLTGRQTDLINLGGVKISPHPVEKLVSSLEGIDEAVGFESIDSSGKSHFALAVVSQEKVDLARLEALVKSCMPVNYPTRFIQVKQIPRNDNGKVLRSQIHEGQSFE